MTQIDPFYSDPNYAITGHDVAVRAPEPSFAELLDRGALKDNATHTLDPKHKGDQRVALAKATVESEEDLVVDLAKVAGHMGAKFAIAPIQYCGQQLGRLRDPSDGEVYFFVGSGPLILRINFGFHPTWAMHFEPGVVMGFGGHGNRPGWVQARATVPPVPLEHRPESEQGKFIMWEQNWDEKILLPRDPALLEHVVGDVYVVRAVWDLTPLEAAALRGKR